MTISSTTPSDATSEKKTGSKELIVYTGRKESTIKPVVDAFAAKTGIKVTIKGGKTGGLINEIEQEKANPSADIFISTITVQSKVGQETEFMVRLPKEIKVAED